MFFRVRARKKRPVPPRKIKHLSPRALLAELIKIGAKVAKHGRDITFQMAEVVVGRKICAEIVLRIERLRYCQA